MHVEQMGLADAGHMLGWAYWRTRDALLRGELRGGRTPSGRWYVDAASVAEVLRVRQTSPAAGDANDHA